jgi:hypothetical protein
MESLNVYREKWREIPGGTETAGRHFTDELRSLSPIET